MSFNDYFDKVYVINLKKREDRLNLVTNEMCKHRIFFERYDAVDGQLLQTELKLRKGVVGCKLSHQNVIRDIAVSNFKTAAVFEDDIILHSDFDVLFPLFYKELPQDWDFVYLGGNNVRPAVPITTHVHKTTRTFALHGYLIKGHVAAAMAREFHTWIRQIDVDIDGFLQCNKMKSYIFSPKLAFQREGYSDNLNRNVNYDKQLL